MSRKVGFVGAAQMGGQKTGCIKGSPILCTNGFNRPQKNFHLANRAVTNLIFVVKFKGCSLGPFFLLREKPNWEASWTGRLVDWSANFCLE